jgi:glycosyltransferase involved in cell wall biosynthesis
MAELQTAAAPGPPADLPVRVLWAIKGLGRGGAEQLLVSAARVADHRRFSYDVAYVLPHKDALVDALRREGVTVHALGSTAGSTGRWLWPWRLRRRLVEGRYDVVHAHSPVVAAAVRVAVLTLPRRRPVTVYTQHNLWQSYAWPTRVAERVTHARDRHRFAVSSAVAGTGPRRVRASTELLVHGVVAADHLVEDDDRAAIRASVRRALGIPGDATVVVTVANLRATKDHRNLLSAARVVADARADVRFLVVGDGPLRGELEATCRQWDLEATVSFLGSRDDVYDLLQAADVFALASLHEGLPVAMMEAMAAGLPAVLTRVGGIPEVVVDGWEALLVPPQDPRGLAAAILELAGDPHLRAVLAERARTAARRFDVATAVRGYERVYEEVARCASPTS